MLSDRSYMRSVTGRSSPGFLLWFIGALVAVFVLQNVASIWFGSDAFFDYGSLYSDGLRSGYFWTLLSYVLLHGSITHLLFNCLGIYFVGKALESELGSTRLAQLSVFSAFIGGLFWLVANFQRGGNVIGASGVAMAYLSVFACLYPRRQMTILLFFVIPITVQPIWLVAVLGAIDLIGFLFQELPHTRTLYGVAHSAHLGGLAAGWIFYQLLIVRRLGSADAMIEPPAWFRRRERPAPKFTVNTGSSQPLNTHPAPPSSASVASRANLRAEVDRILDKINLHGFGSLTAAEKAVLDQARDKLSHR
jgi:membrane associated rhomboid family serine protease